MISFLLFSCNKYADYKCVGEFDYVIENQSSFQNTYLYNSYGYVIGDLNIPGLKIIGIKNLSESREYVITFNYPVKSMMTRSDKIRGEGLNMNKKPLEVILRETDKKEKVFIYQLDKKGVYRLLLP